MNGIDMQCSIRSSVERSACKGSQTNTSMGVVALRTIVDWKILAHSSWSFLSSTLLLLIRDTHRTFDHPLMTSLFCCQPVKKGQPGRGCAAATPRPPQHFAADLNWVQHNVNIIKLEPEHTVKITLGYLSLCMIKSKLDYARRFFLDGGLLNLVGVSLIHLQFSNPELDGLP